MDAKDFENGQYVRCYLDLGYFALERDDATEALRCADKALGADGENVSAWLLRMCALMLSDNRRDAFGREILYAGRMVLRFSGDDKDLKEQVRSIWREFFLGK